MQQLIGDRRKMHDYTNWMRQAVTENKCPACGKCDFISIEGAKWHFARRACSASRLVARPEDLRTLPFISAQAILAATPPARQRTSLITSFFTAPRSSVDGTN